MWGSASAVVHSAIEEFAQELAYVTRRFLKSKAWAGTERIVVGGGFRQSRVGELAIARTDILLKAEGHAVDLVPIRFHPDEAGLRGIGGVFVVEAVSVILQVAYFKRTGGQRLFLMTPIHHHFQKKGWAATKVVARFWILSFLFGLLGDIANIDVARLFHYALQNAEVEMLLFRLNLRFHDLGRGDDVGEVQPLVRIQVEGDLVRDFRLAGRTAPGVQFQPA
mgnify:CR=1 FL=1